MKLLKYFFILALFGCTGKPEIAPDGTNVPFETNVIFVSISKPVKDCFVVVKKSLVSRGYIISNTDQDTLSGKTEFRKLKPATDSMIASEHTEVSIRFMAAEDGKDCKVRLSGKFLMSSMAGEIEEHIRLTGLDGSPVRMGWDELHTFAKSLSPKSLSYEK